MSTVADFMRKHGIEAYKVSGCDGREYRRGDKKVQITGAEIFFAPRDQRDDMVINKLKELV